MESPAAASCRQTDEGPYGEMGLVELRGETNKPEAVRREGGASRPPTHDSYQDCSSCPFRRAASRRVTTAYPSQVRGATASLFVQAR